ncbi:MAG TPA: BTAD domain-containing putative transcriptional regulator [Trebonia sp.]|jgi:DNA-binding SARP family transcriptional activator
MNGPVNLKHREWDVLETLAFRPGEDVPSDGLADDVWGGSPPASADVTLRGLVSDLRGKLGQDIITTVPGRRNGPKGSYRLNAHRDDIDVFAFEGRCQRGQAHMRDEDWKRAHSVLTEAVALCPETSLAGIPCGHALGRQLYYLDELLAQAHEARLEALTRMSLRESASAVPSLFRLTFSYPNRENPQRLLILSLYRAGRHKDAVDAYLQWEKHVGEEIGAAPGPAIKDLNNRITREDEALLTEPLGYDTLR